VVQHTVLTPFFIATNTGMSPPLPSTIVPLLNTTAGERCTRSALSSATSFREDFPALSMLLLLPLLLAAACVQEPDSMPASVHPASPSWLPSADPRNRREDGLCFDRTPCEHRRTDRLPGRMGRPWRFRLKMYAVTYEAAHEPCACAVILFCAWVVYRVSVNNPGTR